MVIALVVYAYFFCCRCYVYSLRLWKGGVRLNLFSICNLVLDLKLESILFNGVAVSATLHVLSIGGTLPVSFPRFLVGTTRVGGILGEAMGPTVPISCWF